MRRGSLGLFVAAAVILAVVPYANADCKAHKPVVVIPGIMGTVLEGFVFSRSFS